MRSAMGLAVVALAVLAGATVAVAVSVALGGAVPAGGVLDAGARAHATPTRALPIQHAPRTRAV
jgi:hypothetical protein